MVGEWCGITYPLRGPNGREDLNLDFVFRGCHVEDFLFRGGLGGVTRDIAPAIEKTSYRDPGRAPRWADSRPRASRA